MSWYSSLVSTASSKVSNLQRTFLNSETDGDTEDDTHVCRVLRSYYTEKGKPFPGWLPPDPKAPPPPAAVYSQPASQVGARYGAASGTQQQQQQGGLSSLWDKNPAPQQQQQQDVQSLRRGRAVPPAMRGADTRQNPFRNSDPMGGTGGQGGGRDELQARPLPSQRGGSYQSANSPAPAPTPSAGGSAQDRLKQRLWGGGARTTSPSQSGPFNPPAQANNSRPAPSGGNGGGGGNYEDRFAPGGSYDNSASRRGADRPFMAANAPWASNEDEFASMGGGGGGGGGAGSGGRRTGGLPSGPRAYR
ncbi:protein MSO1 [Microdochium nivale]|nr:protein MSO1 [Microdochium nivale]